ncbi:Eco29kI family restriction endonuclease [Luteibacter sp.]|uniref:Eco29kI family restriction endonuclease n=1 Tax=Luteibacter sp. TaxID=1886636 RepID=UPI003F7F527D
MTGGAKNFNPLDKRNLGESIVRALLRQPLFRLSELPGFSGAGIYAIYYGGRYQPYARLAALTSGEPTVPIYVGKAVPKGARRGADLDAVAGSVLFKRLSEHSDSIKAVSGNPLAGIELDEFYCRWLVLDDVWIPLGESLVISRFQPLWNRLLDGFGNHDPGKGRYKGKRSRWDVLHPGRKWVANLAVRDESVDDLVRSVEGFLTAFDTPDEGTA